MSVASSLDDADGDGLPDEVEMLISLDPDEPLDPSQDPDLDGLPLEAEQSAGTDPGDDDTDGGGESDGSEVRADRDPLDPDDDALPEWYLVASAIDGSRLEIGALSQGVPVRVLVLLWSAEEPAANEFVAIGTLPGDGTFGIAGPFPPGDYGYTGIAYTEDGATSGLWWQETLSLADDVTPPSAFISVNGGRWETHEREVSVTFFDLTEPVVEMRLAASEDGLESAAWVPFVEETTFLLPAAPGVYIVHAQVRDAAGLVSSPATGVADYTP